MADLVTAVAQSIKHRAELDRTASIDTLTGLRNRRGLYDLIGEHTTGVVMICDLDNFKEINDCYGHNTGDQVLVCVAEVLRQQTRAQDILIRLGGDEFCVIIPDADLAEAQRVAEQIRQATPARTQEVVPRPVTVSIGLTTGNATTSDPRERLATADRALYEAKHAGRNGHYTLPTAWCASSA